jgi:hypothetical protein
VAALFEELEVTAVVVRLRGLGAIGVGTGTVVVVVVDVRSVKYTIRRSVAADDATVK